MKRSLPRRAVLLCAGLTLFLSACDLIDHNTDLGTAGAPILSYIPDGPAAVQDLEAIYLINNECLSSEPNLPCVFENGSVIYTVAFTGAAANLSHLVDLKGACAWNDGGVNCNVEFDQAHIGADPTGERLYVINRRQISGGNPLGYYDVVAGRFIYEGRVPGIGNGVTLAGFSTDGKMYVGDQNTNRIYRIDVQTKAVEMSWPVLRPDGSGLNLNGADLAFDSNNVLYLWTNAAADRGLHVVTFGPVNAVGTLQGGTSTTFFTGMAILDAGTGNIVLSNAVDNRIHESDRDGVMVAHYPMMLNGAPYDHQFGDMSSGRIVPRRPTGVCDGGVTKLVMKYNGNGSPAGTVRGQRRNPGQSSILDAIVTVNGGETYYTFAIHALGGQFNAVANGRLANNFKVYTGNTQVADFHTSCSAPIYPGMLIGGPFELVEVHSVNGGMMGPLP
jgi:hypothetical protein